MHNTAGKSDLPQSQKSLRNCISRMITALMLKPSATIKNRRALLVFYRKGWAKTRTMKSGLIQQQPGLIQAERQHASSCRHQCGFILQNWKCIFRIEPGKCHFRRRSSMSWQDHYGIYRAPSNTGVSWGDFMLNFPEDQAHSCRCNKPSTAGMGRLIPSLHHPAQGHIRHSWGYSNPVAKSAKEPEHSVLPRKATATSLSMLLPAPCAAPLLLWGKKTKTKGLYQPAAAFWQC